MTNSSEKGRRRAGLHVIKIVSAPENGVTKQERFRQLKLQYNQAVKEQDEIFNKSKGIVSAIYN